MNSSLNEMMASVEWGEIKLGDLFDIENTLSFNADKLVDGDEYDYVTRTSNNQGVLRRTGFVNADNINSANTWSLGLLQMDFFYRKRPWYAGQFVRKVTSKISLSERSAYFLTAVMNHQKKTLLSVLVRNVDKTFRELKVKLPIKNGKLDFAFMERMVEEIEKERMSCVSSYLKKCSLIDCTLNKSEQSVLDQYEKIRWKKFSVYKLFGKSTRGKRLKSADRIEGKLPFVTAGESEEGVSDFIGNDVEVFSNNTTTIDMFGSAKYRNYKYGGDDHIAVVHTEKLDKNAAIFVTTAIHRSSHNGQFDYGKNFYAKDADALEIMLPAKMGKPDYELMSVIVSAIHKTVLRDLVHFVGE